MSVTPKNGTACLTFALIVAPRITKSPAGGRILLSFSNISPTYPNCGKIKGSRIFTFSAIPSARRILAPLRHQIQIQALFGHQTGNHPP